MDGPEGNREVVFFQITALGQTGPARERKAEHTEAPIREKLSL